MAKGGTDEAEPAAKKPRGGDSAVKSSDEFAENECFMNEEFSSYLFYIPKPPSGKPRKSGRISPLKQRFRSPARSRSIVPKKILAPIKGEGSGLFTKGPTPLESLRDPLEIIERLKQEPELGFFYLTPVYHRQSVDYDPYNLK